jgi:hypothetical protein
MFIGRYVASGTKRKVDGGYMYRLKKEHTYIKYISAFVFFLD